MVPWGLVWVASARSSGRARARRARKDDEHRFSCLVAISVEQHLLVLGFSLRVALVAVWHRQCCRAQIRENARLQAGGRLACDP